MKNTYLTLKEHPTKKDWRHNSILSGSNVKKMKTFASRKFRRIKDDISGDGSYKKYTCHYDINDFK